MKCYEICDTILLGFLTHNDSYDMLIKPGDGYIKFNDKDIIFVDKDNTEHISHTINSAISVWLEKGWVKEIGEQYVD